MFIFLFEQQVHSSVIILFKSWRFDGLCFQTQPSRPLQTEKSTMVKSGKRNGYKSGAILQGQWFSRWVKQVDSIVWLENTFFNNLSSTNIKNFSNHGGIYRLDKKFDKTCGEA